MTAAQKAVLELAQQRLRFYRDTESKQTTREAEDLKFYQGDGQWRDDIRTARQGQNASAGLPPVPARPCLTITGKIREPIAHVLNEERDADLGIEVVPADDFEGLVGPIDPTEIELREGLIRRIQRQHGARDARSWGFKRSTIAGRGYYGLLTQYVDGKTNDQEIIYRRFYDQSSVCLDPTHEMPDGSDAAWALVLGPWMSGAEFVATYPTRADGHKNDFLTLADTEFADLAKNQPDFYKYGGPPNAEIKHVRPVEYWYTEYVGRELLTLVDGSVVWDDEVPTGAVLAPDTPETPNKRRVVQKQIQFVKTDGRQILEQTPWPGTVGLPIIKIVGEEIPPYDSDRRCEGMVRPARDAVQGFNVMVSAEVEIMGTMPKAPVELDPEQIEGYEEVWKSANVRNWAYLPRKSFAANGQPYQPITYLQREPPIQGAALMVGQFDTFIKSSTGIPDPTLGNVDPSIRSGKGIKALLAQAQQGTSHYLDNLIRSEHYEAKLVNDLLPPIYGRHGRIARILNAEGESQTVMLHTPFVMGGPPNAQRPVAFDPKQPSQQQPKTYTLTKDANFNIAIKVTKSYDTRRQEIEQTLGTFVAADPQATLPFYADLLWKYSDAPGREQLEERGKMMLAPQVQMAIAQQQQGGAANPLQPVVMALQAQLQQAQALLQGKQVEQQGKMQQTALQEHGEQLKTDKDNQTKIEIAKIQAGTQLALADLQFQLNAAKVAAEQLRTIVEAAEEQRLAHSSQAHEHGLQKEEHAHELRAAQQSHQHALEQGRQAADAGLVQSATDAALQPTPDAGAEA